MGWFCVCSNVSLVPICRGEERAELKARSSRFTRSYPHLGARALPSDQTVNASGLN